MDGAGGTPAFSTEYHDSTCCGGELKGDSSEKVLETDEHVPMHSARLSPAGGWFLVFSIGQRSGLDRKRDV